MKNPNYSIDYKCPLTPGHFYHVFNRTNSKERLFRSTENRHFFLQKLGDYLSPFLRIYCYCLIPNHFHLLVKTKTAVEIEEFLFRTPIRNQTLIQREVLSRHPELRDWSAVIVNQFSRFFNCYAKAYNRQWGRSGNLFHRPFKRISVQSENHFRHLVFYLHANPKNHKVMEEFRNYQWSSYPSILSSKFTHLERSAVLEWFGGREGFVRFHNQMEDWKNIGYLIIED